MALATFGASRCENGSKHSMRRDWLNSVVPNPQQGRKELIVIDPQNANPFPPPSVRLEQSFNAGGRICKQLTERTM
jgi:hypothetical protein